MTRTEATAPAHTIVCRLCGADARLRFSRESPFGGLHYFACAGCGSLQTQEPHWLSAAYRDGAIGSIDTGLVFRCQLMAARLWALGWSLGLARQDAILDFGGGTGLLARMLRDFGYDAYVEDRYAAPLFNRPFEIGTRSPRLVTAFEVIEHFPNPVQDMVPVFKRGAEFVLVSTGEYSGQGAGWPYLASEGGQHVFFYSRKALLHIATTCGYHLAAGRDLFLFSRTPVSRLVRRLLRIVSAPAGARCALACSAFAPRTGRFGDQEFVLRNITRPS